METSKYQYFEPARVGKLQNLSLVARQAVEGFISNLNNPTTLDECRSIDVPTVVVCSTNTTKSFRRITELARDSIPGAKYEVLEGAGHMSPLTRPSEIAQIVKRHLETN